MNLLNSQSDETKLVETTDNASENVAYLEPAELASVIGGYGLGTSNFNYFRGSDVAL